MSAYGSIAENGTIRFERILLRPVEQIWDYLTRPGLLACWLDDADIEGYTQGFLSLPRGGVVTFSSPEKSLAFTWADTGTISRRIAFQLQAIGINTQLLLSHTGLSRGQVATYGACWHAHLDILDARLRQVPPCLFLERYHEVIAYYSNLQSDLGRESIEGNPAQP